jgi:hypothetical protein
MTDYSVQDQINDTQIGRPHLVILGAGASRAAFPNGDKNGKKLPLMNDFVDIVGLGDILFRKGIEWKDKNFEVLYATLSSDESFKDECKSIEDLIYDYFSSLHLPDEPTIYDYLLLGLRKKDVIATFNWDPFLQLAVERNRKILMKYGVPNIIYLHGNVAIGYCPEAESVGPNGNVSRKSGKKFIPTQLLYPIAKKDYTSDPFIKEMWKEIKFTLQHAFMVTIFGYGAPDSDVEAMKLFRDAWGDINTREFEEIEVIDILDDDVLRKRWDIFIHSHHYLTSKDFFQSQISRHPRRSLEALWARLMEVKWCIPNPFPKCESLDELHKFLEPLLNVESNP